MHLVYGSGVSGSLRCSCNLVGESVLSLQTSRHFGLFTETIQHNYKCCARGSLGGSVRLEVFYFAV